MTTTKSMTRERKTHVVTIAALIVALGIALGQKEGWRWGQSAPKEPPGPQDAIYGMLDAARAGNVAAYLACYSGGMQASLQQSVRESTEAGFAKYLRDSNAAIKGVAVSDPAAGQRQRGERARGIRLPGAKRGSDRAPGEGGRRVEDCTGGWGGAGQDADSIRNARTVDMSSIL